MKMYQNASSFFSLSFIVIFLSIFSPVLCIRNIGSNEPETLQTYIVRVQPPIEIADAGSNELESWYKSFLSESVSDTGEPRLLHSYSEVFSGFAAKLTQFELNSMQKKEGFVRAFPEQKLYLQTTHTPEFLGLRPASNGLWDASAFGRGVIIGLLDTGIAAGHPSFSDAGVPPPPARWKGSCALEAGCNNKLIGARAFVPGHDSPLDDSGHGTHTASTAAGNFAPGAQAYGQAGGTAAGMAPRAHLAIYKVCGTSGCASSDVLAGLDAAVKDGVDVISISLGGGSIPFDEDVIAIGAFTAFEKGIVVSCAAGNGGPFNTTLSNEAPWYITVGATSVDRSFRSYVQLNNGKVYEGESLNQSTKIPSNPVELAYNSNRSGCTYFKKFDIKGKIVVCEPFFPLEKIARAVLKAGGVGVVVVNLEAEGYSIIARDFPLPASRLSAADGDSVIAYASDARNNPKASITFNGTVLGTSPAPVVAFFSSRGPNFQTPLILKPDVSAPGLNILAAWPTQVDGGNDGANTFNIISGTSMATPHISGIAALIKSVHPDWSAAAVKSAIITTADENGRDGKPILDELHQKASFFAVGAGHVNPSKAADPGLIYDIGAEDYVGFICSVYGDAGARVIVRSHNVSCSKVTQKSATELNLPSIAASPAWLETVTITRAVTNVGEPQSSYTAHVDIPETVTIEVAPPTLSFAAVSERKTFQVRVRWSLFPANGVVEGNLRWVSNEHVVRSPVVVGNFKARN
ncbi:subtilisin-like protease SBT1.7 [Ananas comosus]|uniref:Subtilisin-like protease SBT1.7 n=1 Tax=Ananas comosus TaxID=4615 RepID=A0A6P5FQX5_ANACO|nr:subtilisin-like protease SBT1.7 [Ananas comosus]